MNGSPSTGDERPTVDERPGGVTLQNWDLGGAPSAWAYLHAGELLGHVEIPPGDGPVRALPVEPSELGRHEVEPGVELDAYVASAPVSGIVVVRRGRLVYERYPRMRPEQRHFLMSVSKAFASVLVGVLEDRGLLDLAQPVEAVVPELAGAGWAGVPIRDVLDMASGIDCLEVGDPGAYTDPGTPFYRFEASLGMRPGPPVSTYDFIATLGSRRPSGEAYEYTSADTFVLSWLVERVTGQAYADALGREIWSRIGAEQPAQLVVSSSGAPASHGGLSVTLRDLARFGLLLTPSSPAPVVDAERLRALPAERRPQLYEPDGFPPGVRQWNLVYDDGDLFKGGFGGQGLYVSPSRDIVVAFTGTPLADGSTSRLRGYARDLALALDSD